VELDFPKLMAKAKAAGSPWLPGFGLYK